MHEPRLRGSPVTLERALSHLLLVAGDPCPGRSLAGVAFQVKFSLIVHADDFPGRLSDCSRRPLRL